jgi:hypothetical protein
MFRPLKLVRTEPVKVTTVKSLIVRFVLKLLRMDPVKMTAFKSLMF